MAKNDETIYLESDNKIRRTITENGGVPVAAYTTITKVEVILTSGSSQRVSLNSTDDPTKVSLPDSDWVVEISFGLETIVPGDYKINIKLFDSGNPNGIMVKFFPAEVKQI